MYAGCVRCVLNHAVRAVCGVSPVYGTPVSRFLKCSERSNITAASWSWSSFSTSADGTEQTPAAPEEKKHVFRAQGKVSSVGRKISYQLIRVISETGVDLGIMHQADVLRVMDQQGLKLVLLDQDKDPPVYQLMSGKQIHQEQLKQREKLKSKPATVQLKELTFSPCIASHDLQTKLKQVESWLEKKNHVRITLRPGRNDPKDNLDTTLEQMVQKMNVLVGFVSKPAVIRNGQAAMCVLRQASAKEINQANKENKTAAPS